jgi:hypothetical protein
MVGMLELRLHSGQIVSFDGRVLEIFGPADGSKRLHIANIDADQTLEPDGSSTVALTACQVRFTCGEAPARDRLLAAIAAARDADGRLAAPLLR